MARYFSKDKIKKILYYNFIFLVATFNLIVCIGFMSMILKWDSNITAGIIAFIGAIIGGAITYLGVNRTLKHRDREVFLKDATEKIVTVDRLRRKFSIHLNTFFKIENKTIKNSIDDNSIKEPLANFYNDLTENLEEMYRNMDYDEIEIIEFHKKAIRSIMSKENLSDEDVNRAIEKVRNIYHVFHTSKEKLRDKYYKYSRLKV